MSLYGHPVSDVAQLMRTVGGSDLDLDQIGEGFARAAWSGIAEPGDRFAGLLVHTLGPRGALDAVLADTAVRNVVARLIEAGVEEGQLGDVRGAVSRFTPRLAAALSLLPLQQAIRFGARLLVPDGAGWPEGLDDLGLHAPVALWCRGTDDALAALGTSIALVGARAATGYGEHVTMEAAAGLVDRGYAIVSGAAYGIDGMAHRAALASQGQTVAILAGGVDRFYPSGHDALLTRIVEKGAVLSELPCGQPPTKWRFLQRNRLISAVSLATVVIEAGWRSGSLNTAGHAAALGRPLGAVPGPVTSAASAGCHRLIREFDAVCVTSAEEMAELAPLDATRMAASGKNDRQSPDLTRLLDALSARSPRSTDDVAARSGLAVSAVQAMLGTLELEGVVQQRERGWVRS